MLQLLRIFLVSQRQPPQDLLREETRGRSRENGQNKEHGRIAKDVERAEPESGGEELTPIVRERARDAEQRERHARDCPQYGFSGIAPSYLALRVRRHVIPYTWHALRIAENRLAPDDFALHCSASNTVLWRKYTVGVCKC